MSSSDNNDFLEELKEQAKTSVSGVDEEHQTYVDPSDGTVYEWDGEKRGWFPKVILLNDDLISQNYISTEICRECSCSSKINCSDQFSK